MNKPTLKVPINFKANLIEQLSLLKMFARKFTTEPEDIDDLVQDTVLKAMTFFDKYKNGTNLKGWLYVLMKNIYINNYRERSQHWKFTEIADISQLCFSAASNNKNGGEEKFIAKDIKKSLTKLPKIVSLPFELFVIGYKYHEIASSLQLPIGTVKTRIFVARSKMKNLLTDYQIARS